MKTTDRQNNKSRTVGATIFLLAVGAAVGVAGTHWYENRAANKGGASGQRASSQRDESPLLTAAQSGQWDPVREMREVHSQIDQAFQRSFDRLQKASPVSLLNDSGYSSSMEVESLKDRFEVHVYLPDAKAADAHVSVQGDQLTVEVTNKQTEAVKDKNQETQLAEWGRYDQLVQLPGNVQADKMNVIRKDHELIITLPKTS